MKLLKILSTLVVVAALAPAQTQTATLRGRVTDNSGAVIPSVQVVLTNIDQGRSWNASTNNEGVYEFVQIPPGKYSLAVEARGFKKYQHTGMTLEVAQVAAMDVSMELGSVTETVEVSTQVALLETASSTLDSLVNNKSAEALPLNGRNVLQLVALSPGINSTRSYRGATSGDGSITSNAFSANGGRDVSNEIMLDGSPQIVMGYNQPAYVPTPDALQEFRVQTNSLSAEYGRTGGAVINLVHRSGTKEFHGVLYEFLRNDKFDANGFFNNRNGAAKPPFRYNQFGFTLGGPLTPSRQNTFFFRQLRRPAHRQSRRLRDHRPTAAMKQGDFNGLGTTIYDPATIAADGTRQPFAGQSHSLQPLRPRGGQGPRLHPGSDRFRVSPIITIPRQARRAAATISPSRSTGGSRSARICTAASPGTRSTTAPPIRSAMTDRPMPASPAAAAAAPHSTTII